MSSRRLLQSLPRLPRAFWLVAGLAGLGLAASPLYAQVDYVRDLSDTENMASLLPQIKAPIDTSDPLYDPDLSDTQWIMTIDMLYPFEPQAAQFSWRFDLPAELKTNALSRSTMVGIGTSDPILIVLGRARTLSIVSMAGTPIVVCQSQVALGVIQSIAARDRTNLTMILRRRRAL